MQREFNGISVVIPCLNEAESIGQVVENARIGIAKLKMDGEVVVVDNGSHDGSANIALAHGARVIAESEKGYGAAIRRGFADARYDILVMGDGDLTYDFTRIDELVHPILEGEADFVVGNRMKNIRPGSMPTLHRYVGNPLLSLLLRILFHRHIVRDAHCGLRAISRHSYLALHCVTTGMEFASEMVVRAIHCNVRMSERPIVYHPRVGESKLASFRDGWRHLRFMWLHSPAWALLIPGCLTWLVGLGMAVPLAFGPVTWHGRVIDIHCMILGGLLNAVSIQLITMGLLAKAFAHLAGLRYDRLIAWLYQHITFERFVIFTSPLILIGMGVTVRVIYVWIASGFGPLNEARGLFLGMLCLINGTQAAAAGYLFSILALPRHLEPFAPQTTVPPVT
ncbi:MAG: glycosyltransferase [Lentisphaerae bacterium]|nr:glycosyltransferase [Lentisphaerota bacterium]